MTKLLATLRNRFDLLIALPKYGVALIIEKNWHIAGKNDLLALINPSKMSTHQHEAVSDGDMRSHHRDLNMSQLFRQKDLGNEDTLDVEKLQAKKDPKPKSKALYKSPAKLRLPSEGTSSLTI